MKKLALIVSVMAFGLVGFAAGEAHAGKSCTHNSECKYGGCGGGKCGACTHNSECKGWGGCKSGQCGSCSNNSDCKGFGDCNQGRCTKPPSN